MHGDPVNAFGLVDPTGALTAFSSHSDTAMWALLASLFGLDAGKVEASLTADGWRVVPVLVSRPRQDPVAQEGDNG